MAQSVTETKVGRAVRLYRQMTSTEHTLDRLKAKLAEETTGLTADEIAEYMERTEVKG